MTKVYKLFANVSATTNAAAQLTIQRTGTILAIFLSLVVDAAADNVHCAAELSLASTNQLATNDTTGVLGSVRSWSNFTTSGQALPSTSTMGMSGLRIPVVSGDRLYVHVLDASSVATLVDVFVYVES